MSSMRHRYAAVAAAFLLGAAGAAAAVLSARRRGSGFGSGFDAADSGPGPGPARPHYARMGLALGLLVLVVAVGSGAYWYERSRSAEAWAATLAAGDPGRAPMLMIRNGCAGCHTIPGVPGARGTVGPGLAGMSDRGFIAGVLPNTPENLARWIRDARSINPHTAMPTTGVSEADADSMAAYLYALQRRP
ncbi:c-type cytochrome [Chelatococcus sp. GCM10030263]|uniref:c-type cytochrome n=1 Tax=Chelatococcus sp. GCM10030263 TaxID=3273387 RepID=UPI003610FDD4